MLLPKRGKPMRGMNLMGEKRIKICLGHGKLELPVRTLSGDVGAIVCKIQFSHLKMLRRGI